MSAWTRARSPARLVFNGQTPQEGMFGPADLDNHQQFFETRTEFA